MVTYIIPNTRQEAWQDQLINQLEGKEDIYLIEPDKSVYDLLKSKEIEFTLVDPQHIGGDSDGDFKAAISKAASLRSINGPKANAIIVSGFKTDLDILGSAALITGASINPLVDRINTIEKVDIGGFLSPEWSPEQVDDNVLLLQEGEIHPTKILGCMSASRSVSMEQKVAYMATWLDGGEAPNQFKEELIQERKKLLEAKVQILHGIKVVTCESAGVSSLLYRNTSVAGDGLPFGLAYNPNFRGQGAKFSLLQFSNKYIDASGYFTRMNELEEAEATWGGNPKLGIGGSPLATTITPEVAAKELRPFLTEEGLRYFQVPSWETGLE